jgi:hypothetical protein
LDAPNHFVLLEFFIFLDFIRFFLFCGLLFWLQETIDLWHFFFYLFQFRWNFILCDWDVLEHVFFVISDLVSHFFETTFETSLWEFRL